MAELLKVNDISMVFGGLRAVSNLTMHIDKGELIGLIGPNGAGKTTAFNMITGVYTPTEGEIYFDGEKSSGKKSYQVTQMGMARTFQNIRLFSELSVIDNVNYTVKGYLSEKRNDKKERDVLCTGCESERKSDAYYQAFYRCSQAHESYKHHHLNKYALIFEFSAEADEQDIQAT